MRFSLKEDVTVETEDGSFKTLRIGDVIDADPNEVKAFRARGETLVPVMGSYDDVWYIETEYMYNLLPNHLK